MCQMDKDDKATISRRMSAVRNQNQASSLTALDWKKKKRSQDDKRMIEPEARRKTKVRNTIVCKADIRRKKKKKGLQKGEALPKRQATGADYRVH